MKKALSVLLLCFVILGICSCQKKIITDPDEYSKHVEKSESKAAEASSKQQVKIDEDIAKLESELGKTEKNKQIVVRKEYSGLIIYEIVKFKSKKVDCRLTYKYFDSERDYKDELEIGDRGTDKLIDNDDALRCVVFKNEKANKDMTYDEVYELYDSMDHDIIVIVE